MKSMERLDKECPFCNLRDRILIENNLAYAISDSYPVTSGHTLIIPKRHFSDYFDLTEKELIAVNELLKERREQLLAEDNSIKGFNIGINSGYVAGQTIFHLHVHLIPRRKNDVRHPKGGVRGIIPSKKNY